MKRVISVILSILMLAMTLGTYASAISEPQEAAYTSSPHILKTVHILLQPFPKNHQSHALLHQKQDKKQQPFITRIMLHSGLQH